MTELERFLREARPDCPRCDGTGFDEPDHICVCVPIMIIRTVDE